MQTVKPNGNWMTTSENDREAITQGPEMGPAKPQAAEGETTARRRRDNVIFNRCNGQEVKRKVWNRHQKGNKLIIFMLHENWPEM